MANAGCDFSTSERSNEAGFGDTTATQIDTGSFGRWADRFDADSECHTS
jgi:hypothetical protein